MWLMWKLPQVVGSGNLGNLLQGHDGTKLVHWDNPEGWNGEGGGRWQGGLGEGDTCTPAADSCQCTAKTTTILQSN